MQIRPTTDDFAQAGDVHDIMYQLVPKAIVAIKYNGRKYLIQDKLGADRLFKDMMYDVARSRVWWKRRWFYRGADINYAAVVYGGKSSFKHDH